MLVLPCCRRCCGSVDWDGGGAEGASAIGSEEPPPDCVDRCVRGGEGEGEGMRGACPPPTCRPSAKAAAEPAGGIDAAAMRGGSGPPKCG